MNLSSVIAASEERGHGGHDRGTGRDLQDAGAELAAFGHRGEVGKRADAVHAPGLSGPQDVHAEAVSLSQKLDLFFPVPALSRRRPSEPDGCSHARNPRG